MNLKEIRVDRGISLIEASRKIKISKSALSRYEKYQRFPNKQILRQIKQVYNLTNEQIAKLYLNYYLHGDK